MTKIANSKQSIETEIYDGQGNLVGWTWLLQHFGNVGIYRTQAGAGWRIVKIEAMTDGQPFPGTLPDTEPTEPAILEGIFLNPDGTPMPGIQVARWWQTLPGEDPLPDLPEMLQSWKLIGLSTWTDVNGRADFGMGGGDAYWPPAGGASWMWGPIFSDCIYGLGWLAGTNHWRLKVTWQWIEEQDPEPPITDWIVRLKRSRNILNSVIGEMQDWAGLTEEAVEALEAMIVEEDNWTVTGWPTGAAWPGKANKGQETKVPT